MESSIGTRLKRVITMLALMLALPAFAAPGDLDPSFSDDGMLVISPSIINNSDRFGRAVKIQADGRIVVGGGESGGRGHAMRLLPNGTLDTSFGGDGTIEVMAGIVMSIAQQSDGKILFATTDTVGGHSIVRFNIDGTLDSNFGNGGSSVLPMAHEIFGLVIQPDGKSVVVGYALSNSYFNILLARFNPDGSPDTSFGGDGIITTGYTAEDQPMAPSALGWHAIASDVAIQADGKLIVSGYAFYDGYSARLLRYNSDGSLDSSFDSDGIVWLSRMSKGYSVALQTDGRIVVAGTYRIYLAPSFDDYSLMRFNDDGSPDTTFGQEGTVIQAISPSAIGVDGADGQVDLAIQADGRLVVSGMSAFGAGDGGYNSVVLRFKPNGALDSAFGDDGVVITRMALGDGLDGYTAVALQTDGKIVTAGYAQIGSYPETQFSVARYEGVSNHPPSIANVTPNINVITTAPNHSWVRITLSGATDPDGDAVTYTITGVSQDEAVCGSGSGATGPDAEFRNNRTDEAWVRAERDGSGDGRVYRLYFLVTDSNGATTWGSTTVSVPKSSNGIPAIDSGAAFDSLINPGC